MTETAQVAPVTAREVFGLLKPRIALFIMLSAVAGIAITPGPVPDTWRQAMLAAAVFLAAGAAGAFNHWAECDLDARMKRTRSRPFASGRLHPGVGWLAAILALLGAAVALAAYATNGWAAFYTFMGAFTYGVVYTLWLKRRTCLNIVIGGLAGSFAVLAGAAAVDPGLGAAPVLLAVVLFLWTPPHFWSLAVAVGDDYASNGVPMLPAVVGDAACAKVILAHSAALSVIALLPAAFGMGWIYLTGAVLGGALFTGTSVMMVREPTRRNAIKNFAASLSQLLLLITGTVLDRWLAGGLG